ncbi:MAG: cytidine deaminase [Actinomycetota bacterium]|nr:MAG: cytidine deaminase [Actinomycetota bacterium]
MVESSPVTAEDAKLVTLARGARARVDAAEGAAVRDETGRTYSAATVGLTSLALSALQLAVAQAIAAGARGIEAAAVVTAAASVPPTDLAVLREAGGTDVPVLLAGLRGDVTGRHRT